MEEPISNPDLKTVYHMEEPNPYLKTLYRKNPDKQTNVPMLFCPDNITLQ